MMGQGGYAAARDAFSEVISRDPGEVRGYYWTGMACYRAAEYKQTHGDAATADVAPQEMTVENLYQEALRHFRRAMELTPDKGERDELASAASTVTRAVARKRGRL
jgi:tetratricopeptide (TPR) repeat protein